MPYQRGVKQWPRVHPKNRQDYQVSDASEMTDEETAGPMAKLLDDGCGVPNPPVLSRLTPGSRIEARYQVSVLVHHA